MSAAPDPASIPLWLWAVITALPFAVGVYSTRITHTTARQSREASPYDLLARRVTDLEVADGTKMAEITALRAKVRDLQDAADTDAHYIARLVGHIRHLHGVLARVAPEQPIEPMPER